MNFRNTVVDTFKGQFISFGGIVQMGDSYELNPKSYAIAVQREYQLFFANEGNFAAYPIFQMVLPEVPITENIKTTILHENTSLHVQHVYVLGTSFSGIVHIGSTKRIHSESRIKHIRQLLDH